MKIFSLALFLILSSCLLKAQSETVMNQTDAAGLKQGLWKKNYPNGNLMYEGFFKDGKPVGEMRRFFESGALKAVLNYNLSGESANARLFYEDGSVAAEGRYFKSLKDSIWTYFSYYNKNVTATESYNKGVRHGTFVNYYGNGDISEKLAWTNDKKSGKWEQFFKGNIPKLTATFTDDKLDGEFVVYYINGKPYTTGVYRNNLREGKWTFYNEDGTVQNSINYRSGQPDDEKQLNAEQQEFFRSIDEARGKFDEPDETDFLEPQNK